MKVGRGEVSGSRCSSLSRRTDVPVARNSVACSPQTWFFTSTVTPTMPEAPSLLGLGLHPGQRELARLIDALGELGISWFWPAWRSDCMTP